MRLLYLFVVCLASVTVAYDIAGGYERLFYYYAYLIDVQLNGSPQKIAVKCRGKSKICTFNEFCKYITQSNTWKVDGVGSGSVDFSITDAAQPPVDVTAQKLLDNHATGPIKTARVWQGIDDDNAAAIQQLFAQISGYISGQMGKFDNDVLKNGVRDSIARVVQQRQMASSNALTKGILSSFPAATIVTTEREVIPSGTMTLIDTDKTRQENSGLITSQQFNDVYKKVLDKEHKANIVYARNAQAVISEACSR